LIADRSSFAGHGRLALPGHPGLWCSGLNERLAEQLIERTLDRRDVRLREMTQDLSRFSNEGQLELWRPGRDLIFLEDDEGVLMGLTWIADKPLPERDDYFDPELMRGCNPQITVAIRTYGLARGKGVLTKDFADFSRDTLVHRRPDPGPIWFETKAHNKAARSLGRQTKFVEVSGEAGGTVVGVRFRP
jgi:hypothetical protein